MYYIRMNDQQKKILEAIKESEKSVTEIIFRFGNESVNDIDDAPLNSQIEGDIFELLALVTFEC